MNINRQQQRYKAWNKADLKSKVSCFVFRWSQVILVAIHRLQVTFGLSGGQMGWLGWLPGLRCHIWHEKHGPYAWFPALRFRSSVSVSVTVSVKPCPYLPFRNAVAVMPLPFRTFGAEWACRIASRPPWPSVLTGEFPALPSGRSSRPASYTATEKI